MIIAQTFAEEEHRLNTRIFKITKRRLLLEALGINEVERSDIYD